MPPLLLLQPTVYDAIHHFPPSLLWHASKATTQQAPIQSSPQTIPRFVQAKSPLHANPRRRRDALPCVWSVEAESRADVSTIQDLRLCFRCELHDGRPCTWGPSVAPNDESMFRRALPVLKASVLLLQCQNIADLLNVTPAACPTFDLTKLNADIKAIRALEARYGPTPNLPHTTTLQELLTQLHDDQLSDADASHIGTRLGHVLLALRTSNELAAALESLGVDIYGTAIGGLSKHTTAYGDVRWACQRHARLTTPTQD
ncbi:Aste57867_76 [Aphanomyces stellatus]|uniref:Aste57867_76 protein n=1 Tax=Aphanomyces stellatus TaxID=120398 RepID=A0A485K4A7_9STRA|nr:hypothetical protein As57867_000076 [Aphanomyces stellatus]VFT77302.1 Aste57867_76 [Aphanomyces stellatus]